MANYSQSDAEQNKVIGVLSVFPVLFLVYFISGVDSEFAHACSKWGIIFTICFAVMFVLGKLLSIVTWIPLVGTVINIALKIIDVVLLLAVIVQVVRAAKGTI
ncbi:MAG: hypothetical protein NC253_02530 [Ruminococcus sp.]|nr:hypothetical protein [Ruminococcus sp.]MCM1382314.1 hypothetical protein [Muribaculaceae bacterium]MCM1479429.1 hypothetical protein [Muribaculaceae bacterium]